MVATSGRGAAGSWALAPSLVALVHEADQRWPDRSTIADGSIGDADHASRTSDHNPSGGWVHAVDLTHDPVNGMPGSLLVGAIVAHKDPRVAYVIHNGRVWRSYDKPGLPAWTPEPYRGPSPHTHHVHVSINHTDKARQDTRSWFTEDDMTPAQAEKLDELDENVRAILQHLEGTDARLQASRKVESFKTWIARKVDTLK